MLWQPNIFLLLFFAATAGILLNYQAMKHLSLTENPATPLKLNNGTAGIPVKRLLSLATVLAAIAYAASWQPVLQQLLWVFFRMGAFLFGGGFSMIPFIQQEVVTHYHWLTLDEFVIGIALGQVTPGPILITATFVGYKVAAIGGAIMGTLGIFLPSLFLVMATAEVHQRIRHNLWVKSAIKGIVASFTGMMVVVAFGLARHSLVDIPSTLLATATFVALRYSKLDTVWVVLGGTVTYWVINMFL